MSYSPLLYIYSALLATKLLLIYCKIKMLQDFFYSALPLNRYFSPLVQSRTIWQQGHRKRQWVVGMLEVGITTRRPILKLVKIRSRRVLLRVIRRHDKQGSYIMSDEWRAY